MGMAFRLNLQWASMELTPKFKINLSLFKSIKLKMSRFVDEISLYFIKYIAHSERF